MIGFICWKFCPESLKRLRGRNCGIMVRLKAGPQLVDRILWDKESPSVKLYIINPAPEILTEINPAMDWFITTGISEKLQNILGNVLFYNSDDARRQSNIIGHNAETFAGIYSRQTAEHIVPELLKAAAENQIDLQIRKEEIAYGN